LKIKIFSILIVLLFIFTTISTVGSEKSAFKNNDIQPISNNVDWWPMLGHDPQHSGVSTSLAPKIKKIKWIYDTGSEIRFSSPIVVDDKVFIGTGEIETRFKFDFEYFKNIKIIDLLNENKFTGRAETGGVFCLNTSTGIKKWDFVTEGMVSSTPVFYNEKVYILSCDSNTYQGRLYCLNAETGSIIWNYTYTNLKTTPVIEGDSLYISIADPYTGYGYILCLNPNSGVEIWNHSMGLNNFAMYSAPTVYNGKVYYTSVVSSDVEIHCLNAATGLDEWYKTLTTMELGYAVSTPVVKDNQLYIISLASYSSNQTSYSILFCLNTENGDEIWRYTMLENDISLSNPAVDDNKIYFSYNENYWAYGGLACLDTSNGSVIWDNQFTYYFFTFSSPTIADEKLFIGAIDEIVVAGAIKCYNISSGAIIWSCSLGEISMVDASAAIANEQVYIADYWGKIYAFCRNTPPNIPEIKGEIEVKKGTYSEYNFSSIDPDSDDIIEFIINWDDGTGEEIIIGPFASGEEVIIGHTWNEKRFFEIKAKAKDIHGDEGDWGTFTVTVPRNRGITLNIFEQIIQRFPLLKALLEI
jgi:outer membrane protein assembly factor BamB